MKKYLLLVCVLAFVPLSPLAAATCVNLSTNLASGSTDSSSAGQVTLLQRFLASENYLTAKPNGVFGPSTLSALKKFQLAHDVSPTGTLGPLTRSVIKTKTCVVVPAVSQPQSPQPSLQSPATSLKPTKTPITSLNPRAADTLMLGQNYSLSWNGPDDAAFSVILEDASSTPQGFIVPQIRGKSYSWIVGSVSTGNSSDQKVAPGSYRIHVQDVSQGHQSTDVLSGLFTIEAVPIKINQIFPATVPADNNTSVVLYGSGFSDKTVVNISGYGNLSPLFVSSDGRALIFAVPTSVFPGYHTILANTLYESTNTWTNSNVAYLTIVRP
jgi:peptidoglycan hydrolase-like protein with peptidoglycan-binding domain